MITPFLESFPEDFSIEVDGDTYICKIGRQRSSCAAREEEDSII